MKRRGITNRQAKFLAALQRKAGERYTGHGLSSKDASKEIARVMRKLGRVPAPAPEPYTIYTAARAALVQAAPRKKERAAEARERRLEEFERNRVPSKAGRDEPLESQLHDLAVLARRAGEPIPRVSHRGDAVRELVRLRSSSP